MPVYPISRANLTALLKTHNPTAPIYMLNLWKHRPQAIYPPSSTFATTLPPCTGHQAIERYIEGIIPLMPPNSEPIFESKVKGVVAGFAGTGGTWVTEEEGNAGGVKEPEFDTVVLVRYETLQGFVDMVTSETYVENVQPHRVAALEEFRLIALEKLEK